MPKQHPFDEIFQQISELLINVRQKPVPPISSEDSKAMNDQLNAVEETLKLLEKITDDTAKQSRIHKENTEQIIEHPENVSKEERKILETARQLRGDLENLENAFTAKMKATNAEAKEKKFAGTKRKKKFKRLGGEGWMPL